MLAETSGAIVISGPAGSGKTTTAYACLREIAQNSLAQRSLMSIEDPIEVVVPGVAQSQVNPQAGLDLATGLRFLMRQDPEVILVGEIRDRITAEAALQASLTGHLLLTTFHAGSAAETVGRLLEMGIEPYILQSGLLAVINQRLLRRLCQCAKSTDDSAAKQAGNDAAQHAQSAEQHEQAAAQHEQGAQQHAQQTQQHVQAAHQHAAEARQHAQQAAQSAPGSADISPAGPPMYMNADRGNARNRGADPSIR